MERKWPAVALVAGLVLCAGTMMGCAPAAAEESSSPVASEASTLGATSKVASPEVNAPPEVEAPQGTPAEAVAQFTSALVSGDLAAVTLSFAPSGLAAARALVDQNDVRGIDHFNAASVDSIQAAADPGRWEIVFALSSSLRESKLWTRWEWFPDAGWRIVAMGPRG